MVIYAGSWLPFVNSKTAEFYFLRFTFAIVCALCEVQLFKAIGKAMSPRIANLFMLIMATSAGMFHAAISYLPSSFAIYTVLMAAASFMDWTLGIQTAKGLFWLSVGAVLGWPFVGALAIPYLAEEAVMWHFTEDLEGLSARLFQAACGAFVVLLMTALVDYYFYHKVVIYSFQLVWYNVFGGSGKGPNIFGTEPWHYYIRNLLINFNLWFVLACAVAPLVLFQRNVMGEASSRLPFFRTMITISPFYLWLAIFTLQPHKEERFMYPVYPFLALNAALAFHIIINIIDAAIPSSSTPSKNDNHVRIVGSAKPTTPSWLSSISPTTVLRVLKPASIAAFLLLTTTINLSRSLGLATAYSAPLSIYTSLPPVNSSSSTSTSLSSQPALCLGKEWYRFPSSYHLPPSYRPAFIPSDFHGLLPGAFSEAENFGFFPGAWLVPSGMNDENREDLGKLTREEHCDWLVESWFAGEVGSEKQPDRMSGSGVEAGKWDKVRCERFLDQGKTGVLGRLFWMPEAEWVPKSWRRQWGEYCLLRRKV